MTRHLVIQEHGRFVGTHANLVQVRNGNEIVTEAPLSRIGTVTVAKSGVSISSDLVQAMAARGARLFFLDFRGAQVAALQGTAQQATVAVRRAQLAFAEKPAARTMAGNFVEAKVRNQRALLRYFAKYHEKRGGGPLTVAADQLEGIATRVHGEPVQRDDWHARLLGNEGEAAAIYFRALRAAGLTPPSFEKRTGRGAREITNAALNLGYAILLTRVWTCLANTGLECYAGLLHRDRPGKPSLVLDMMEAHRAFLVDRSVLTLRTTLTDAASFDAATRRKVIKAVNQALDRRIRHRGRKLRVETVMQRQAYRLAGNFAGQCRYRPLRYAW